MVLHPHEIPLVPSDLGRPATVNTFVDILTHLDKVIDDIFKSITTRIDGELLGIVCQLIQDLKHEV